MTQWDVLIAGAGPAGAATALHLARAGYDVLLIDRARFPRDKPCSEYLNPAAAAALARLGPDVSADVAAAGAVRLRGMKIFAPGGAMMAGQHGAQTALALPRRALDAILVSAAARAGAVVRDGVTLESPLAPSGGGAGARLRTPGGAREDVAARVVVGADGLHSAVARRLGWRTTMWPRRVAFTAHVAGVADVHDWGEMHIGRGSYAGLGPVGGGLTTIALVVGEAEARRDGRALLRGFVRALDRFPALRGRVPPTLARRVLTTGPLAQWSTPVVGDGALLVGDAADFFDPFTGQGLFAALRGAELAAAALDAALQRPEPVTASGLAPYRRARVRAFAGKWALERAIGLGVGWPALADRVVSRLGRRPALADLMVGACGNLVPARAVFAPPTLAAMLF